MKMTLLEFILLGLAVFRLTRLIVFDKITEFIRKPFFDEVEETENGIQEVYYIPKPAGVKKFIGELLSCYWCTGIWASAFLAAFFYITPRIAEPVIVFLAAAGFAAIVEAAVQRIMNSE